MANRKVTDHFDLLPYIAILMCTLGTLLLMTLSMTAINLGPAAGIGIVPTTETNRPSKLPMLIEWDGENVHVHHDQTIESIKVDDEPKLGFQDGHIAVIYDDKLNPIMDNLVKLTNTDYALFVVRPSGFSNFMSLRGRFDQRDIPLGYEPFEQGRPVRLLEKKPRSTNSVPTQ